MWAGFPHSDILGSKPVCRLPEAFRRLPRPSSPVIAKASTTCTYSLDPITLGASVARYQMPDVRYPNTRAPTLATKTRAIGPLLQRLVAIASSFNKATIQSSNPVNWLPLYIQRHCPAFRSFARSNRFTSSTFLKNSQLQISDLRCQSNRTAHSAAAFVWHLISGI